MGLLNDSAGGGQVLIIVYRLLLRSWAAINNFVEGSIKMKTKGEEHDG